MLSDSKDNPEAFLVKLTPESSPKRPQPQADPGVSASPELERRPLINVPITETSVSATDPPRDFCDIRNNTEVAEAETQSNSETKPLRSLGKSAAPARALHTEEKITNNLTKKVKTPVRKSVKENIKPRVIDNDQLKKASATLSSVKPKAKSRIGHKPSSSDVKQPIISSDLKQPQSETKRIPLSKRPVSSVPGTPSRCPEDNNFRVSSINQSAAKTLQFTPKNSVPRAPRRESMSAVKAPMSKPASSVHQFKLPSKTTEAHLKKTIVPPRTGKLQPTRLSLAPSSSTGANSSSVRPRLAPLRPLGTGSLPKPSSSALPRSGLQRPGLYRQGAVFS